MENWRQFIAENEEQTENAYQTILNKISQGMPLDYASIIIIQSEDEQLIDKFYNYLLTVASPKYKKYLEQLRNYIMKMNDFDPELIQSSYTTNPYEEYYFSEKKRLLDAEKALGNFKDLKNLKNSLNESETTLILEKCWPGYEKKGMKKMFGKMYPNCVKKSKKKKKKNENVDIKEAHGLSKKDAEYIKKFAEKTKDKELKKILNFLVTSNVEVDVTHDVTKDKKNEEVKAEVIEEKAASASYCKKTPCKKMGFTQKASCKSQGLKDCYPKNEAKDPKKGTGKKPKGSGRRLYTDENPKDTVSVKFKTVQDIKDTLSKESFKSKSHKRQSQIINLIHQRARAAYQNAKDPKVKARLKKAYDYAEKRKEASKEKTKRMNKKK